MYIYIYIKKKLYIHIYIYIERKKTNLNKTKKKLPRGAGPVKEAVVTISGRSRVDVEFESSSGACAHDVAHIESMATQHS